MKAKISVDKNALLYSSKSIRNIYKIKNGSEEDDSLQAVLPIPRRGVLRKDNEIYFYDDIDEETQVQIQIELENAKNYLVSKYAETIMKNMSIPETIVLHINSSGGLLSSSLALYDILKGFAFPIIGIVEGEASSGATIMLCGCSSRSMRKNSTILCHELRSGAFGKYSSLKDSFKNNDTYMKLLKKIYLAETNMPDNVIDDLLSHDIIWDASTALKYGIVDYIMEDEVDEESLSLRIDAREQKSQKIWEVEEKERSKMLTSKNDRKKDRTRTKKHVEDQ